MGHQRTSRSVCEASALPPTTDIVERRRTASACLLTEKAFPRLRTRFRPSCAPWPDRHQPLAASLATRRGAIIGYARAYPPPRKGPSPGELGHLLWRHPRRLDRRARWCIPHDEERWGWACGFYPGSHPGECTQGAAASFDEARAGFERTWKIFLAKRTEADFAEYRRYRASTA
jgi:hypothetical protein